MPRRKSNARDLPKRRRTKAKPQARVIWVKDDKMSPGRLVAVAEWRDATE